MHFSLFFTYRYILKGQDTLIYKKDIVIDLILVLIIFLVFPHHLELTHRIISNLHAMMLTIIGF